MREGKKNDNMVKIEKMKGMWICAVHEGMIKCK